MFRKGIGPLLPGTEHVPPADPFHCLWDPEGTCETCGLKCASYIDYVLEKEGDVCAVIAEPIRNTAINPPPAGYWKAVRDACDRHGALLIFDETAVCLGRTGKMFAFENFDVVPDVLTIGKGLGGGVMPFAAMIARKDMDVAPQTGLGHYTHEKNPLACAAGIATIQVIEEDHLLEHASKLGRLALEYLTELEKNHQLVGNIRGLGLMFGAELMLDGETKAPAYGAADRLMYACLRRGLSFKVSQGNFLTLNPPLIISKSELEEAFNILDDALTEVENNLSTEKEKWE
jgi:4-aminobutyrate aminotransferase